MRSGVVRRTLPKHKITTRRDATGREHVNLLFSWLLKIKRAKPFISQNEGVEKERGKMRRGWVVGLGGGLFTLKLISKELVNIPEEWCARGAWLWRCIKLS